MGAATGAGRSLGRVRLAAGQGDNVAEYAEAGNGLGRRGVYGGGNESRQEGEGRQKFLQREVLRSGGIGVIMRAGEITLAQAAMRSGENGGDVEAARRQDDRGT